MCLVVTVTDGQDLDEPGVFTSCRESSSGVIRCESDDRRTARIRYIPNRFDPNLYRYKLEPGYDFWRRACACQ